MFRKISAFSFILIFSVFFSCASKNDPSVNMPRSSSGDNDVTNGYVRLVLNENLGSFSLFYLTNPQRMSYEPLFNAAEPLASYTSVYVDGNVYRLGDAKQFSTSIERIRGNPAFIFESSFLKVTQVFTPVKTENSDSINGVEITTTLENTGTQLSSVGLRLLIDTELGEGRRRAPFLTNTQLISNETLIECASAGEKFWISRGERVALMGSILNPLNPNARIPDFVHFASWKRLNESRWRLNYVRGRTFNNLPDSMADSAVCYIYEPSMLERGKERIFTLFLTTEDVAWYSTARHTTTIDIAAIEREARAEAALRNENANTLFLLKLQNILNQFIAGEILLTESNLTEIETVINRYRN
ncbi:MAG: hypothetical protein LBI28_01170 [Treponema sp.]|jgi:hypothetical protein|nr:hypothetical protein [Treponema sp.]